MRFTRQVVSECEGCRAEILIDDLSVETEDKHGRRADYHLRCWKQAIHDYE